MAIIEDDTRKTEPLSPAPQLRSPRAASLGTEAGAAARSLAPRALAAGTVAANTPIRNIEAGINTATAWPRAVGNQLRDASAAFRGEAAPAPIAPISLPRLGMPRPAAAAPAATSSPAAPVVATKVPKRIGAPTPAANPAAATAGSLTAAGAAMPTLAAPTSDFNLQPGDVNTFTGADGVTRPVPGLLRRPAGGDSAAAAPAAGMQAAPALVSAPAPELGEVRGRQGGIIRMPGDSVEDRLTRALGSASLRGSPSARAAVAKGILDDEAGIREERQSALATGDQADLATLQDNARSQESHLLRQQRADEFNIGTREVRAERAAERADRQPTITTTADGSMGIVSPTGTFTPVTDAAGARLRAPLAPKQTGELTQGDLLKSYTDRYNAISGGMGTTDEKKVQIDALNADPLYAQLLGRAAQDPGSGMTLVGTHNGKNVYRDAAGKTHIEE
jgi:hypothetical protein